MANRYWIGGSGNWNDTAHWAATSGGTGGESVPGDTDDVFVDANSLTALSRTITLNVTPDIKSLDCSAVNVNAIISGNTSMTVAGSFTLNTGMTFNLNAGSLIFDSTSTTCNVTTDGVTIQARNMNVGGDGTVNLMDDLTISDSLGTGRLQVISGNNGLTFNTNNVTIVAAMFQENNASNTTTTINLGSSTITTNVTGSSQVAVRMTNSNTTLNAGTSNINVTGNTVLFVGGGKTYYNVNLTGTPTTIQGSNTFANLTISPGKRVNFTQNTTTTGTIVTAIGTVSQNILFRSTAGTATLCVTNLNIAYVDVSGIIATCGASPFFNPNGIDSGGNTNWIFSESSTPGLQGVKRAKPRFAAFDPPPTASIDTTSRPRRYVYGQ